MKATEAQVLSFLKQSPQFVIPIYQRSYSWLEQDCRQLWTDILRAGHDRSINSHFIGSVVYVEKGLYSVSSQSPLLVIDGQQRLTTVSLLIEALARAVGAGEPVDGFSERKLRDYYLLNPLEDGERRYKLILSETDRTSLVALLDQRPLPEDHSIRVKENFDFFKSQIERHAGELEAICKGLAKLMVVDISLNREQDNPQLIFESLNSTGRELSQADLIRNFVLMGLEPKLQTRLYVHHWRPMELAFGQESYTAEFDGFMRHYLTFKTGSIPKLRDVYDAFKAHARSPRLHEQGIEALVADIHRFAGHYCAMALGHEKDPDLKRAFADLRELTVDVAFPLLLELYDDYSQAKLDKPDLVAAARLIESYVFRRAIIGIPTNSLNKTFATFTKALRKDRYLGKNHYLESVQAHFQLMPTYRRFPTDEEFHQEIQHKDLYHFPRRSYWLRRMENHQRKERVPVDEYTIEHIMPQNENLSAAWREEIGEGWQDVRATWLHTLGNLTLTGYNSEMSDRPFGEKKTMSGGFAESPLRINEGLGAVARWDESAIRERAARLATKAVEIWSAPKLSRDILETCRPKPEGSSPYSIEDYGHLANPEIRQLFDALRKEILSLDPCVFEEVFKTYIAYKAETNFVDVVPQATRLRLSLNMRFRDIADPKAICKDVTNLGRWGNGDVEVGLSHLDELPYVIGLVRQSLEKQMGNGDSEA